MKHPLPSQRITVSLIWILSLFTSFNLPGQVEFSEEILKNETMPELNSHDGNLLYFVADNVKYPVEAKENCMQGTVYLKIVIDSSGNVAEATPLYESFPLLVEASIEAVKMSNGQWTPATREGKKVDAIINLPVSFRLDGVPCLSQEETYNKGVEYFQQEYFDTAISYFKRALIMNAMDVDAAYNCAIALLKKGEVDEACEYLHYIGNSTDAKSLIQQYCQ